MTFPYNRALQGLYVVIAFVLISVGGFLFYLGWGSYQDISEVDPSSVSSSRSGQRQIRRMAGRASGFTVLMMIGGACVAIYSIKPLQTLVKSMSSYVEIKDEGLVFVGIDGVKTAYWSDVKKVTEDDFTGLEIKVPNSIIVIPSKKYENWDELVRLCKEKAPANSARS